MHYRTFDSLGVELSVLGFGCMRFPVKDGRIERDEATAMLDYAYRHGVNYFDTAWGYHNEESQYFVGEALSAYPRDSFHLATKMPVWLCERPSDFDKYFTEQLVRCKTDYFDFYLLHALTKERFDEAKALGVLDWLTTTRTSGAARHVGFSFHDDPEVLPEILDAYDWDFVQIQHNYIDDEHIRSGELYRELTRRGIPAVVMEPIRGGHLATLPDDVAGILKAVRPERSPAAWALQWVASQPGVMVTLSGMSTLAQVEENVAIFSQEPFTLTPPELTAVTRAAERLLSYKTIDCTDCRYCQPCPHGVGISHMFEVYNRYQMFHNAALAASDYSGPFADLAARADACTECETCIPLCPQHIAIPDRLAEVHEVLSAL